MKIFQNLSIKFKILSIVFGGLIGLSATQILNMNSTHQTQKTLTQTRATYFPVLELLDRNIVLLERMKEQFLNSVITSDEDMLGETEILASTFLKNLTQIENLSPIDKIIVNQIVKRFRFYNDLAHTLSLSLINEEVELKDIVTEQKKMNLKLTKLEVKLKSFRKQSYQKFVNAIDKAKKISEQAMSVGIIFGIFAFCILIFTGLFVSTSISRNIKNVDMSLKELSSGSGDLSIRLHSSSNDELGMLVMSFNDFIEKLHSVIGGVINLSHYVAIESNNLKQRSQMSLVGMNSQTEEISEIVISMAKMSNQVHSISENANNAADEAQNILKDANEGRNVVEENMKIIELLSKDISDATKVIEELEKHSTSIGSVLNVIQGIS